MKNNLFCKTKDHAGMLKSTEECFFSMLLPWIMETVKLENIIRQNQTRDFNSKSNFRSYVNYLLVPKGGCIKHGFAHFPMSEMIKG